MTRYAAVLTALMVLTSRDAYSEGRITGRVDFNRTTVDGAFKDVGLDWQGFDIELDNEFKTDKVVLSGFAVGVRRELFYGFSGLGMTKDIHRWDEGTYLTVRLYRAFAIDGNRWSIGPSFAILYGIPGTTLDRTVGETRSESGLDYAHIFPVRNTEVPNTLAAAADLVSDSAMFYPEASVSLRRRFAGGALMIEWLAGVRVMRFGIVESNGEGDSFNQKRMFIPTVGLRAGFRIF
jgi:hypothetical protein